MMHDKQSPLLEMQLLAQGIISRDQLRIAKIEQQHSQLPLDKQLLQLKFLSEDTLQVSLQAPSPHLDLQHIFIDAQLLVKIPKAFALRHQLLPISCRAQCLQVAMANPDDLLALDQLHALLSYQYQIDTCMVNADALLAAIDRAYGFELSIDGILDEIEQNVAYEHQHEQSHPMVRLIDAFIADAVQRQASDIHFEPEAYFVRIRYRIDGVLRQIRVLHKNYWSAILIRLKIIAQMNITESRVPQDGRLSVSIHGRHFDLRVASHPTMYGENIVLRILDQHKALLALEQLGLSTALLHTLKTLLHFPNGIILVTGPTGSGKTTTLYAMLNHINDETINIMTLEDPVEYTIPRVRQSNVSEFMDFAQGVRALLRQDPDVIFVGEIRDQQTAQMAFSAAMTGHLVFSTLHCHSARAALPRLTHLGLNQQLLINHTIAIIAQRLLRRLCQHCKRVRAPLLRSRRRRTRYPVYRAVGCKYCDYQGYRGRLLVMELLLGDIAASVTACRARYPRILLDAALQQVYLGETSFDEVQRVIGFSRRSHDDTD